MNRTYKSFYGQLEDQIQEDIIDIATKQSLKVIN